MLCSEGKIGCGYLGRWHTLKALESAGPAWTSHLRNRDRRTSPLWAKYLNGNETSTPIMLGFFARLMSNLSSYLIRTMKATSSPGYGLANSGSNYAYKRRNHQKVDDTYYLENYLWIIQIARLRWDYCRLRRLVLLSASHSDAPAAFQET